MIWTLPALALAAGVALVAGRGDPDTPAARPELMLMTALPIIWGEGGVDDVLAGRGGPLAAFRRLEARFTVRTLDAIDAAALKDGRLMLLAQPRALAPGELVDLDAWVRGGGRALILTDPALVWPSEHGLGDSRRPPRAGLLDPLLAHWGLALEPPEEGAPVLSEHRTGAGPLRLAAAGRFTSGGAACRLADEALVARCRIGAGDAILVADADLLDERLWDDAANNMAVVESWLDELAASRTGDSKVSDGTEQELNTKAATK